MFENVNDAIAISAATSKNMLDSQIITQTLDVLNANSGSTPKDGGVSESYQFNKDVLSAAYDTKGTFINGSS